MKKFAAILFTALIIISLICVPASAASAINANEQAVLSALSATYKIGKTSYTIPSAYILQARNYFLTINLTKAQADKIISYINSAVSKAQKATQPTAAFSIGGLPGSAKKAILKDAQNACAVIGCKLTYNVSKKTVTIKSAKGTEIFNSGPIVKRTGANMDATPIYLTAVITVTLFLAALIISKKARFFE